LAYLTTTQLIIVLVIGVVIFGRRLPDLGHYLVKGIKAFKRGMEGGDDGS
jgi:TatA/E family protein of Tat protein translocase